ncbi:MAG: sulfatase-like hydrolase/transferase [Caldilineaceae bacterium SB0675_bin_29]|uniref:Sulfatase-like hydrolase/transferase n=1 Tax=Caldilineaceae bacterium SB0675_bin_29 TaxID=2605266 RepID=A0A6B1G7X9_9CHLR|nr:sulfatase-like hydrolase/transferase [Caldilineaceae bacterium SB0675_bin_29]
MSSQPNVLFLIADDHRASAIGAYGDATVRTPTLDQLCTEGASFRRNCHMGGLSGAVCVPTRACLHTGAHVFRASVGNDQNDRDSLSALDPGHTYLAELFRQHGYTTFATGKWHNDSASFARSFGEAQNVFFGGMDSHFAVPVQDYDASGRYDKSRQRIGSEFSTDLFGDAAIRFLERQDGSRPFFLYCAFTAPHDPRTPPQDWAGVYRPEAMPLPVNFAGVHPFDNGEMWVRDEKLAEFPRTAEDSRRHIAEYYGMISDMDEKIGEMLDTLARKGLAEDTIVVYTADHGLSVGQHGLLGKQNLYDHSVRVPLILRGPGVPGGKQIDALSHTYDVYPTLCELAGLEIPASADAKSLAPLLAGTAEETRPYLHSVYKHVQRMTQDREWKLITYRRDGDQGSNRTQLFHLASDPWELKDLSEDASVATERERLEEELARWQEETGDPVLMA